MTLSRSPTCPLCHGLPCSYEEHVSGTNSYHLEDGKFVSANRPGLAYGDDNKASIQWELGALDATGKFTATCGECGHEWVLRGQHNIDQLIELHGYKQIILDERGHRIKG